MPEAHVPTYQQTEAFQRTLGQLAQEVYLPLIRDLVWLNGHGVNRFFRPSGELATQQNGGLNKQMITRRAHAARNSTNPLLDTPTGGTSSSDKIKLRFDINDLSQMDFVSCEASAQLHFFDRFGGGDQIYSVLENAQQNIYDTLDYRQAVLMHSDRSGVIWESDAVKLGFDGDQSYSGAPVYSSGATEITVHISSGLGIGVAREGVLVDFYERSSGDLLASNCLINQVSFGEDAYQCALTANSQNAAGGTVSNFDAVDTEATADDLDIYLSGSKGNGYKGALGEIFRETYSASENWFGGKIRAASGNGHYIPQRTRVGASAAPMSKRFLDDLMQQIGNRTNHDTPFNPVLVAGLKTMDSFRASIGEEAIKMEDTKDRGDYTIGELTLGFIHPAMGGMVGLMGDNYAREDRVYVVNPDDTEKFNAEFPGPMPTTDGWAQRPATGPNGGWSKYYDLAVMEVDTKYWNSILRSGCIFGVE